jgi:VIT1/CCC1 family predicted Fe2+/Mn2+ transporter
VTTDVISATPKSASRWAVAERATVREILMGAQDNLTNVLAVVLGVTIGAGRADLVALAGLSAAVAESISMGGVLYTATRAEADMAADEAAAGAPISAAPRLSPMLAGVVTFAAAMLGGLLPLAPFAFLPIGSAVVVSLVVSVAALFALGAWTTSVTRRVWWRDGLRLVLIAGAAALAASLIGATLHVG